MPMVVSSQVAPAPALWPGESQPQQSAGCADCAPVGRRARVLWLIKGLGWGGAEKLLSLSAPHLDRGRFEYEVGYFLPWKNALVEELRRHDLPVTCFDLPHGGAMGGWKRLLRHLARRQIDVLHMHLPVPGIVGRVAGKLAGVPALIYTEHNVWPRLHPLTRLVHGASLGWNDRVIAVSDDVRRSIRSRRFERVLTIRNGIDSFEVRPDETAGRQVRAELGIAPSEFVIGNVANFTPKKNHELLLDAYAQLQRSVPHSRLVLVGQFAGREGHLRLRAEKLAVSDRVVMTGPRSDAVRIVQALDVFAMSSSFEGLPIALLEAMSLGRPAVCTAVGGIPEAVNDGVEGFLVPPGDAAAMALSFARLAADRDLRRSMGLAARARVKREFDIAATVRRLESVYAEVLQEKGVWTST